MSLLQKSKTRQSKIGSAWERLCDTLFRPQSRALGERKSRRLMIDQLEERALLSVSATSATSKLITTGATILSSSLASDKNGDFVVTWAQEDNYSYQQANGSKVNASEANVYAEYFTNDVQRITLDSAIAADHDGKSSTLGTISIQFGGNEVQELSVTATTPTSTTDPASTISGTFKIKYTPTGGGPAATTATITFDETTPIANAANIQKALRALGFELANVVVTSIDDEHYNIAFGNDSNEAAVPTLVVTNESWSGGFLTGATITTTSQPKTISNIKVSTTTPSLTASAIVNAFQYYYVGQSTITSTDAGVGASSAVPTVTVTSVKTAADPKGLCTFDIEFTGDCAYTDVPTIKVTAWIDTDPSQAHPYTDTVVTTIKQNSGIFRVNPEEYDDPFTQTPDFFNQTSPSVAMDADGDFVITWASDVPDFENEGSVSDIFARMYTPAAVVQDVQLIEITPTDINATSLAGTFTLTTDKGTTAAITFNSADLATTAGAVRSALVSLGYGSDMTVAVTQNGSSYDVTVAWGNNDSKESMSLVSYTAGTLAATATATFTSGNMVVNNNHDSSPETAIQSVRPVKAPAPYSTFLDDGDPLKVADDVYTFRVNVDTANAQGNPSAAMDDAGDFTITWSDSGQTVSFFNNICMRMYNKTGVALTTTDVQVSNETTDTNDNSYVTMSNDGHVLVVWNNIIGLGMAASYTVYAKTLRCDGDSDRQPLRRSGRVGRVECRHCTYGSCSDCGGFAAG